MAKRTRGSRRDRRRGGRQATFAPPIARPAALPQAPGTAVPDTSAEEGAPAQQASLAPATVARSTASVRPASVLAVRAADEYRYVALDLRRIGVVMGALFGLMIVLWVLVDLMKVVTL